MNHRAGRRPAADPRLAQIERLKAEVADLRARLGKKDAELDALKTFQTEALSRITAQHDEITAQRRQAQTSVAGIRLLKP